MNEHNSELVNMDAANKGRTRRGYSKRKLFPLTVFLLLCIGLSSVSYIDQVSAVASITLSRISGPAGSTVTVTGSGFAHNTLTSILFDFAFVDEATTSASGAFTKSITIPTTASAGNHKITANDGVNSVDVTFTVTSQTRITISPTTGATGTIVTVSGSNFGANKAITIKFDDVKIATIPASVKSSSTGAFSATIVIPNAAAVGSHTINATDGTLTAIAIFNVSQSLVTISPVSGAAGTAVTVTGSGFAASSSVTISFDSTVLVTTPASVTTTTSGTFSATITIPTSVATGSHTISATDTSGRSGSAIFNITTSGTLTLSSNTGIGGTTLLISGSGYAPNSVVTMKFDSTTLVTIPATVATNAAGSFSATITIPTGVSIGTHTISSTDNLGRTASAVFSVTTAAVITISPITGLTGTEVTVTGSNFAPNTKVSLKFGEISVRTFPSEVVASNTGTFIAMFDVPAGVSGSNSVTAKDDTGRVGISIFTVSAPRVSLSPINGNLITIGTPVTVSGSGFAPNTEVTIFFDGSIVATNPSRITTTSTGSFTATLTIPATASVGSHTISAQSSTSMGVANLNVLSRLQSSITLSSTRLAPRLPLTVSGSGFSPNASLMVKLDNKILATTVTTSTGSFFVTFNMPTIITAGSHTVSASDGINSEASTIRVIRTGEIVSVTDLKLVDQSGLTVSRPSARSQVLIQSDLRNNLATDQDFAYIVQVKDSQGATVMISWMSGTLTAGKEYSVAQSWLVEEKGRYSIEVFTWDSISNPNVLAPSLKTTIRV